MFSRVHPAMRIQWANKHFSSAVGATTADSTSRIYRSIVDNSRGLTLIGGTLFLVIGGTIGGTAAFVHKQVETANNVELHEKNIELLDLKTAKNKELLEKNRELLDLETAKNIELVDLKTAKNKELLEKNIELLDLKTAKNIELVEKSAELAALKNTLLFGQSEEYKSMRDSYAKREVEAASGARGKHGPE